MPYSTVSAAAVVPAVVALKVVVAAAPTATEAVASVTATVTPVMAALAGVTDTRPVTNPATATSEIRLKVVFVDMFFLSLVELRTIRTSAWAEMSPS
jgi:hypothetical protein